MPQVYRRHSEYSQRPETRRRSSVAPQPIDADDSIVLSDLVRTGEASRLRRRGAMRIDHARAPPAPPYMSSSNSAPRPIVVVPSRTPTPPYVPTELAGEDEYTYSGGEWRDWNVDDRGEGSGAARGAQTEEQRREGEEEEEFMLFCGGEEWGPSAVTGLHGPSFAPSPLPGRSRSRSASTSASGRASSQAARRTNGCGALVHMRAYPQRPRGVWVGKEEATEVVVGLDASYFERSVVAKMMKSACGCVREGIGCAVCGNTLGTRYMPCQAASEGIFSRNSAVRTPPALHPSGPRYWQCRPPAAGRGSGSGRRTSAFYVYTFFADHVSPSRPYGFPGHPSHGRGIHVDVQVSQESRASSPSPAPAPGLYYGYRWTASPRPISPPPAVDGATSSAELVAARVAQPMELPLQLQPLTPLPMARAAWLDVETSSDARTGINAQSTQDGEQDARTAGMELDADGVLREVDPMDEPNSPDKGNEPMLWPGR
ncbi:hypothetical protein SCP_0214080 [Sparassis crispa]|uniref:Uncharacterized protein n=1 Tax=Sparassis crispa TaxID=139825 RepID=A0A401GDE1_9APHY|nr:hypothetical protein SCP_0214080 [Sparassis crispa]GBE80198.1 hypothetical protein SCP_0214080 [Sparassis crispa]